MSGEDTRTRAHGEKGVQCERSVMPVRVGSMRGLHLNVLHVEHVQDGNAPLSILCFCSDSSKLRSSQFSHGLNGGRHTNIILFFLPSRAEAFACVKVVVVVVATIIFQPRFASCCWSVSRTTALACKNSQVHIMASEFAGQLIHSLLGACC